MSLIYGFNANKCRTVVAESSVEIRTFSTAITFRNYNKLRTVNVFNSGIVLLGISTTSTHNGVAYYDIYNSGRTVLTERIQAHDVNYFAIQNKNGPNTMTRLRKAYTLTGSSSVTIRMGFGSKSDKDASIIPLRDPLTLNVALHYIEIPNKYIARKLNNESDIWI